MVGIVVLTLLFMTLSSLAEVRLGMPRLGNFLHLPVVLLLFAVTLLRLRSAARPLAVACGALALVFALSAAVNGAGAVNAGVGLLLLCEPFFLLTVIVNLQPAARTSGLLAAALLLVGLLQIPFAMAQAPAALLSQDADLVKGAFVGMVAGHHVAGALTLACAAYVWSSPLRWPRALHALVASALILVTLVSDTKQAILAAVVAGALALPANGGPIRERARHALWVLLATAGIGAVVARGYPYGFGFRLSAAVSAFVAKLAVLPLLASHFERPVQWVLGLGPGHGVSRLGGWLLARYWQVFEPLGATRTDIAAHAWKLTPPYGNGSSLFCPLFSWAGIFGDVGLGGLVAYGAILVLIYRRFCVDGMSRVFLFAFLPLGLIFDWLEEPHLMSFLVAAIGQRWLSSQAREGERVAPQRLAVLLPAASQAWHPFLAECARRFGEMRVFFGEWRGYAEGFERAFDVEVVGGFRTIGEDRSAPGYRLMLTYASPRIVPALLRYRPDVVLANSFGVWSLAALVFAPIGGWRVVIAYEGSSPGVDYADSRLRLLLRAAMARAADGLMTNTRNGALYLQSKLSVPPGRMAIQPYIVPSPELFDATSPLAPAPAAELRRPVFLVVAALVERKNVRCVLDACSRLPADSYSLVVVGVGPQRSELEAHAERVLGARRVVWLGHIPYREVGAHMRDADVLILPSLEDTLGTVVLEAMLCATPAVCSTGAGAAELVIDDENGFRFDARDPADLALRLRRFIDEPDLAGRLGRRAQQRMSELTPAAAVGALQRLLGLRAQSPRHRSGRS